MTEVELSALEALANGATPGPWHESPCSNGGALLKRGTDVGPERHEQSSVQIVPASDAAYIAAMHPQTTLGLIAEVRRLRALVESAYEEGEANGIADAHGWANDGWDVSTSRYELDHP